MTRRIRVGAQRSGYHMPVVLPTFAAKSPRFGDHEDQETRT